MEVYIEYVVLDNLLINSCLATLTCKTLKLPIRVWRIVASAVFGTIMAVCMPVLDLPAWAMFLFKLLVGICMVPLFYWPKQTKKFVLAVFWFFTYTFCFGGAILGLLYAFSMQTTISGILIYGFEIPISLIMILLVLYIYLLYKATALLKKKQLQHCFHYNIIIKQNNQSYHLEGFLDSGNRLYDNGQPITIISQNTYLKLFGENFHPTAPPPEGLKNPHIVQTKSIHNQQPLLVFMVDEICVLTPVQMLRFCNMPVGIASTNFNNEFDCLLHQDLVT